MIDDWVADGTVHGASVAVWHRGNIAATRVAGNARDGVPVVEGTFFALASVSKPMTVAAVMRAVDEGRLSLDLPVAAVVPEFGEVDDPLAEDVQPQLEVLRDRVTIRQLLSHTSGLPENVGSKRIRMRDLPGLDNLVDAMCGLPLVAVPGSRLRYSNAGIGVASRALEYATNVDFHQYLQSNILDTMGLADIAVRPGDALASRLAYTDDAPFAGTDAESYNTRYWQDLGIPWGGYFGTPSAVVRFAASFFNDSTSPLSFDSREEMITDQTGGVPGGVDSAGVRWPHGAWGLGWEVVGEHKERHWTGSLRSPRTFCHWGNSGTLVWADPDRELAVAVFGNRTVLKPWPLRPPRWAQLSDALVAAADGSG
jgi:beta-lactamase class C